MNAQQEFRLDYDTTSLPLTARLLSPCSVPADQASNETGTAPAQRLPAVDVLALCMLEGVGGG
ncbi:MAG TPA: hypothetical protein VF132_03075 [Rudaea sp.]